MRYFGINIGHDASLVGLDENGKVFFHAQAERYQERQKNHCDNLSPIFSSFNISFKKDDFVVICPAFLRTTPEEEKTYALKEYDECLIRRCDENYAKKRIGNSNLIPNLVIDHHFAHALSSWFFREDDEEKFFISYDGCGPWADEHKPYKSSLAGNISSENFSIQYDHEKIPSSMPFNHLLGKYSAGKLMGLAGHLPQSKDKLTHEEFIKWMDLTASSNFIHGRVFPTLENSTEDFLALSAKIYNHYMNFIWIKLKQNIEKFSQGKGVLIGGGTALALETNTKIYNLSKNLTFGPAVDDSGLALGAASFAYFHINKKWPSSISTPNLNNNAKKNVSFGPQDPQEIANLLFKNKTIGLIRGKSEIGPRALGFRSILSQASEYKNLKKVSQVLKGREYYRPLAPIVTSDHFEKYFVGPKGKYMQYKCMCNKICQEDLPAIVHKDLSARPQVVYKEQDPWLYSLLKEYGSLSGSECLINTSLNGKNKPICSSLEDAVSDFKNKEIQLISINDKLDSLKFI